MRVRGTGGKIDRLRWPAVRTRSPVTIRSWILPLAGALLVSGCGAGGRPARPGPATTPQMSAAAGVAAASPASPAAASARPTSSRRSSPVPTRRPGSASPPLSLTLIEPQPPLQGGQITALYQYLCGDPSRGLVNVDVADPANIVLVWFEYHVHTTVPFDGANRGLSVTGDFRAWRGGIGPFDADPRNAAGGPIAVIAHGEYRDGSQRTVSATWTLRSCYR